MATPAKVGKPEGKNNHDNADEQAGERRMSMRVNLCIIECPSKAICFIIRINPL
jgi:hypothetical protein